MKKLQISDHVILLLGVFFMVTPVVLAFLTSTHDAITIYKEGNDILQMKWASKEVRKRHFCTLLKLLDVSPTSDKTLKTTVKG